MRKLTRNDFFSFPSSIASCLLNLGWIRFDFLWQEVNTLFSDIKSHVQVFHYAVCVCVHMTLFSIVRKKFRFFHRFLLITFDCHAFFFSIVSFFPFEHKTEQGMNSWYDYIPHGGKFNWSCICRKWSYYFSVDFSNFLIGFGTVYGYVCVGVYCVAKLTENHRKWTDQRINTTTTTKTNPLPAMYAMANGVCVCACSCVYLCRSGTKLSWSYNAKAVKKALLCMMWARSTLELGGLWC